MSAPSSDVNALHELWGLWLQERSFIQHHARVLTRQRGGDVDELTDEVLQRAVSATLRGFGPRTQPLSWLKRLLVNTCADQYRRRRHLEITSAEELMDQTPGNCASPESALIAREARRAIERSLATLPDALRVPLEQRVLDGASYASIASTQYISTSNARKRVQLARRLLRSATSKRSTLTGAAQKAQRRLAEIRLTPRKPDGHVAGAARRSRHAV